MQESNPVHHCGVYSKTKKIFREDYHERNLVGGGGTCPPSTFLTLGDKLCFVLPLFDPNIFFH